MIDTTATVIVAQLSPTAIDPQIPLPSPSICHRHHHQYGIAIDRHRFAITIAINLQSPSIFIATAIALDLHLPSPRCCWLRYSCNYFAGSTINTTMLIISNDSGSGPVLIEKD